MDAVAIRIDLFQLRHNLFEILVGRQVLLRAVGRLRAVQPRQGVQRCREVDRVELSLGFQERDRSRKVAEGRHHAVPIEVGPLLHLLPGHDQAVGAHPVAAERRQVGELEPL
eukprot:369423-Rhodomonas_salina.1